MKPNRTFWACAALAMTLSLGACWNDDDDDDTVTVGNGQTVPDSAGASTAAFLAYLLALSPNDETSEPSAISNSFAVPPDDVGEPQPLT